MNTKRMYTLLLKSVLISAGSLCVVSVIDLIHSLNRFNKTINEINFNDINKDINEYSLPISNRIENEALNDA